MTRTDQMEEASDSSPEPSPDTGEDRRLWEAREEIAELQQRLSEQGERERILELEIGAVRKDLAVKIAYAESLERAAEERLRYVTWLQDHFDLERKRADDAVAELAAERARIYYRILQPLIRMLRGRGRSA